MGECGGDFCLPGRVGDVELEEIEVESKEQTNLVMKTAWTALFAANLMLGVIFWFGLSTDYKLRDTWADIGFTWLVGTVGFISWILVARSMLSRPWKISFSYFVAPSIIGSTPYILLSILGIWLLSIIGTPPLVDEIESPDRSKLIKAYYLRDFLSDYCLHSYQITLQYRNFPIVRRDITVLRYIPNDDPPRCIEYGAVLSAVDTEIEWLDNRKIIVPDREHGTEVFDIGLVKFDWPIVHMRFFAGYVGLLMIIHGIQRLREQRNEDT
ncbi:MAG TPA: hypothetical protein VFR47_11530 [Anaerolineales bacterium]|nr:hypothetical protein [Anaerolineales bacterium]